jgi:hypothetical protein
MLVLDANILIRAVLGSRVLALLRMYTGQIEFLTPDKAFDEARERLPEILERRKVPAAPSMAILDQLAGVVQTVEAEPTKLSNVSPASASTAATRMIGRSWPSRWRWAARSGPRTPTSSAAAWRRGPRIAWSCTWRTSQSESNDGSGIHAPLPM